MDFLLGNSCGIFFIVLTFCVYTSSPSSPSPLVEASIIYSADMSAQKVSDSVELILEAHFDGQTVKYMEKLITNWQEQAGDEGAKQAILFLYMALIDNFDQYMSFIDSKFSEKTREENPSFNNTHKMLEIFARHASGTIDDSDPMFIQSRVLSSLAPEVLKTQIGSYFKTKSSEFLHENYKKFLRDLGLVSGDNDNIPGAQISAASAASAAHYNLQKTLM